MDLKNFFAEEGKIENFEENEESNIEDILNEMLEMKLTTLRVWREFPEAVTQVISIIEEKEVKTHTYEETVKEVAKRLSSPLSGSFLYVSIKDPVIFGAVIMGYMIPDIEQNGDYFTIINKLEVPKLEIRVTIDNKILEKRLKETNASTIPIKKL